jgi:hypothetical protein
MMIKSRYLLRLEACYLVATLSQPRRFFYQDLEIRLAGNLGQRRIRGAQALRLPTHQQHGGRKEECSVVTKLKPPEEVRLSQGSKGNQPRKHNQSGDLRPSQGLRGGQPRKHNQSKGRRITTRRPTTKPRIEGQPSKET